MRNMVKSFQWQKHKLALVTLGALIFAIVIAYFFPLLTTDTCCRSAPMAEAFASGDWVRAFHPRFAVGLPAVAGTLRILTGLDGYTACSVAASIAWAISIVPLFFLAKRVFDETTAWFAVVLYLVAPMIFIWSLMGLRESFKVLGLLMMTDAVFRCREGKPVRRSLGEGGWRNFAEAAAGLAFLVFFKVDAIVYGILMIGIYMCVDRFRRRSWLLLLALAVYLQPCCALVYDWTGMWVPAPQYAMLLKRLIGG